MVWALVVVAVDEAVEPGLLLKEILSCRLRGLEEQLSMARALVERLNKR
jgi:hypothetical protein